MSINPSGTTDPPAANGFATRRPPGPPGSGKEATQQMNGRSTGFGGFGRGEGGALGAGVGGRMGANGGGVLSPGNVDSRMPGPMGGGFAGVGKRVVSRGRTESNDAIGTLLYHHAPFRLILTLLFQILLDLGPRLCGDQQERFLAASRVYLDSGTLRLLLMRQLPESPKCPARPLPSRQIPAQRSIVTGRRELPRASVKRQSKEGIGSRKCEPSGLAVDRDGALGRRNGD